MPTFEHLTDAEIREAIAGITEVLEGHLPNIERAFLVADRKDFREALEARALLAKP